MLAIEQVPRLEAFQSFVYRIGARQPRGGKATNRQGHTLPTPVDPQTKRRPWVDEALVIPTLTFAGHRLSQILAHKSLLQSTQK